MEKEVILVTGGAGFIASNFIVHFIQKYPQYHLINLDALTYAADLDNVKEVEDHPNYTFVHGDIRDRELLYLLFETYRVKHVIHFAAESHVDNSIKNPLVFVETNVVGTVNLLDCCKMFWMDAPFVCKKGYEYSRFHHVSTDEVYGTLGSSGYFTESSPYAPNSPYSASKASADMMVRSYFRTYGLNTVITNCSNNYGPKQHDEKLIPTLIHKALKGEHLPIYGNGQNVRDWLYVQDHCEAIDLVFHYGKAGETYAIGAQNERTNIQVAEFICDYLDRKMPKKSSYKELIRFVEDRPGHDFRYAINPEKIEKELLWKPKETFETGMKKTLEWYINKYKGYES
jgi:dTDP-glucose 4,6-dehydratase